MRKSKPYAILGDYNSICDQCGFKYKTNNEGIRTQWNNLRTCPVCYEERQPQDFVRGLKDNMTVPIARPDNSNPKFVDITKDDF